MLPNLPITRIAFKMEWAEFALDYDGNTLFISLKADQKLGGVHYFRSACFAKTIGTLFENTNAPSIEPVPTPVYFCNFATCFLASATLFRCFASISGLPFSSTAPWYLNSCFAISLGVLANCRFLHSSTTILPSDRHAKTSMSPGSCSSPFPRISGNFFLDTAPHPIFCNSAQTNWLEVLRISILDKVPPPPHFSGDQELLIHPGTVIVVHHHEE